MANPFDQFDAPATPATAGANPFDQFDTPPAAAPQQPQFYPGAEPSPLSLGRNAEGQATLQIPRTLQDLGVNTGWRPIDQLAIPFASQAASVLSGAADAGSALWSLPADLMGAAGVPGMTERGERMRKNSVAIPLQTPAEKTAAGITQYGVPAAAGAKLAAGAGPLAQWLASIAADFGATSPDTAATLGDIAGMGPTDIKPEDNALVKRGKVAAEAPIGQAAVSAVKNGYNALKQFGAHWTDAGQRAKVGQDFVDAGMDSETLGHAVQDAKPLTANGYQPTTADLVGSSKALEMQKGAISSKGGQPLRQRIAENADAIAKGTDQQLAPVPARENAAADQFSANRTQDVEPLQRSLAEAEQRRVTARADLQGAQSAATAQARTAPAASADLDQLIRDQKAADTAVKSGLYNEASQLGRSVDIDPVPFAENARTIRDQISPLAQGNMDLTAAIQDLDRLAPLPDPQTGVAQPTERLTLADLIDMRPRLSRAISLTNGKLRGDVTQRLMTIYSQIGDAITQMGAAGEPAAQAWLRAEDNFRNNFAPKYRTDGDRMTLGGKLDKAERGNNAVAPTAVAGEAFKPSGSRGAIEATADLQRIFADSPNREAAVAASRRYLIGSLADDLGAGRINADRATQWLNKYRDAVDAVPGVRQEVQQMINRLQAGEQAIGPIEQEIRTAAEALGAGQTTFDRSPAGLWLGGDVSRTVDAALANPRQMDQLMTAAERDPSGEAVKEVRNRISEAVNIDVRNTGSTTGADNAVRAPTPADYKVSFDKVAQLLSKRDSRAALTRVYGEDGVHALDRYLTQLKLMARGKSVTAVAGSDTILNEALSGARNLLMAQGGGITGSARVRIVQMLDNYLTGGKINELRVQALTDPELALALTMELTPKTKNVVARMILGSLAAKIPAKIEKAD